MIPKLAAASSSPCQPVDESTNFSDIPNEIIDTFILKRLNDQDLSNFRLVSKRCKAVTDEYVYNQWDPINTFIDTLSRNCEAHKNELLMHQVDKTTKSLSEVVNGFVFKAQAHMVMLNLSEMLARLSEAELAELKTKCIDKLPDTFENLFKLAELTQKVGVGTRPEDLTAYKDSQAFDTAINRYGIYSDEACKLGAWNLSFRAALKSNYILAASGSFFTPDEIISDSLTEETGGLRENFSLNFEAYGKKFTRALMKEACLQHDLVLRHSNELLDIFKATFENNRFEVAELEDKIPLLRSARKSRDDDEFYSKLKLANETINGSKRKTNGPIPSAKRRRGSE